MKSIDLDGNAMVDNETLGAAHSKKCCNNIHNMQQYATM